MIFLTETLNAKGLFAGDNIKANSLCEARDKCPDGYRVIGRLILEIDARTISEA